MKALHIINRTRNAIVVDYSKNTIDPVEPTSNDIDYMYVAPEDTQIFYKKKDGETITLTANKGDIILKFYEYDYTKNPIIVVKNNKWKENLISRDALIAKRREDDLAESKMSDLKCCDCECCNCCGC